MDDYEAELFGDENDLGYDEPASDNDADAAKDPNKQADAANSSALSNAVKAKIRDLAAGKLGTADLNAKPRLKIPKFDANVVLGENGLPRLANMTKNVRLKGRNHEVEDLRTIMHIYEYWAHTLAPRLAFEEVVRRLESLGKKREVKTWLLRMRLNMLLDDHVAQHDEDGDGQLPNQKDDNGTTANAANPDEAAKKDRPFDELDDFFENDRFDFEFDSGARSRAADDAILYADADLSSLREPVTAKTVDTDAGSSSTPLDSNAETSTAIDDDVRKKIEENRRRAMERRAQLQRERATQSQMQELDSGNSGAEALETSARPVEDNEDDERPLHISDLDVPLDY